MTTDGSLKPIKPAGGHPRLLRTSSLAMMLCLAAAACATPENEACKELGKEQGDLLQLDAAQLRELGYCAPVVRGGAAQAPGAQPNPDPGPGPGPEPEPEPEEPARVTRPGGNLNRPGVYDPRP